MKTNRGMYLENIIDKTMDYYQYDNEIFFIKYHTKNTITRSKRFIYISNNFVDYFGYYKNRLFVIEAKQNNANIFNLNRINEKQLFALNKLNRINCLCFLLLYFNKYDEFYLLDFKYISNILLKQEKNIKYNQIKFLGTKLELRLPGILNLKENLQKIMSDKDGE